MVIATFYLIILIFFSPLSNPCQSLSLSLSNVLKKKKKKKEEDHRNSAPPNHHHHNPLQHHHNPNTINPKSMKIKPKSTQTHPKHNLRQYPIENPFGKPISTQNPRHRSHGGLGRKREIF